MVSARISDPDPTFLDKPDPGPYFSLDRIQEKTGFEFSLLWKSYFLTFFNKKLFPFSFFDGPLIIFSNIFCALVCLGSGFRYWNRIRIKAKTSDPKPWSLHGILVTLLKRVSNAFLSSILLLFKKPHLEFLLLYKNHI